MNHETFVRTAEEGIRVQNKEFASVPVRQPVGTTPNWDNLFEVLQEVIRSAIPLLRADGVGLMLLDQDGALRWVTATNEAERAFEQAERDLGEGPCIDAFTSGALIWTSDLRADSRWLRLGPPARANQVRGVLSAPVVLDGRPSAPATRSRRRCASGATPTTARSGLSRSCSAAWSGRSPRPSTRPS
jgi:GAF domain-containing protein